MLFRYQDGSAFFSAVVTDVQWRSEFFFLSLNMKYRIVLSSLIVFREYILCNVIFSISIRFFTTIAIAQATSTGH
jgi:hypothetical protein